MKFYFRLPRIIFLPRLLPSSRPSSLSPFPRFTIPPLPPLVLLLFSPHFFFFFGFVFFFFVFFPAFAEKLAAPFDLFVNDAFGTAHRAHGSTEGVTKFLSPYVAGFLLQKELDYLEGAVKVPARPFAAIVGGSKVSSKIGERKNRPPAPPPPPPSPSLPPLCLEREAWPNNSRNSRQAINEYALPTYRLFDIPRTRSCC